MQRTGTSAALYESPDREAPQRLSLTASCFTCPIFNFEKHRSETSILLGFGSLHFRDNWEWPFSAVRMWLICSNRKLHHKKRCFCYR